MSFLPRFVTSLVAASALWLGGASVARADCKDDTECKAPRICDAATCREPQCAADADCLGSQACSRGRCVPRAGACKSDVDCPGDQLCVASVCQAEPGCKSDVDCPGDQLCTAGRCVVGAAAASPAPPPVTPVTSPPGGDSPVVGAAQPPPAGAAPGALAAAPHQDESSRKSKAKTLFIGAGVLFGTAYLASLPITAASSSGRATGDAAVPFAGPFLILANHDLTAGGTAYYAVDAAFQLGSLVLVGYAIKELVSGGPADTAVHVSTVSPDGRGPGLGIGFSLR